MFVKKTLVIIIFITNEKIILIISVLLNYLNYTGLHLNFWFCCQGFLTDYKLLFNTEFKYENRFAQSTLVF